MMEEQQEDVCLHMVALQVFTDAVKTGDPEAAGKAYAEFYMRFKTAYHGRMKDLLAGDDDYRYTEILQGATQTATAQQAAGQTTPSATTYDPEEARRLKEASHVESDSFNKGRSF